MDRTDPASASDNGPLCCPIATRVDYEFCSDQPRMLAIPLTMEPGDIIANCMLETALRDVGDANNLFRMKGLRYYAARDSMSPYAPDA